MSIVLAGLSGIPGGLVGWWLARHPGLVDPHGEATPWPLPGSIALAIATAVVSVLSLRPSHYALGTGLISALFGIGLVTLAGTDFKRRVLPNRLTYPLLLFAIAVSWIWPDRSVVDVLLGCGAALAIAAGLIVLGLLASGGRNAGGAFGIGDMKLIVLLGALLGWPLVLRALILGTALGGVVALGVMMRSGRGQTIAYGPYLIAGGVVALLWPTGLG
jgi:leader peptidase (prepilin peptidase)/N-methyltransferase